MRERADFFVCPICAMVVLNPSECSGCQSLFCGDCIAPWREKNNSCPKKCQGNEAVEFRQVHRLVQQDLNDLKFKCFNEGCCDISAYKPAMEHKITCGGNGLVECPQGCGLGIKQEDIEFHIKNQCSETFEACKTCGEKIYSNREEGQTHDCIQTLKKLLEEERAKVKTYEDLFESG